MSSLPRRMQRKRLRLGTFTTDEAGERVRVPHNPTPQTIIDGENGYTGSNPAMRRAFARDLAGGYVTVRYTKGPLRVSAARLRAQASLAAILHPGEMREQARLLERVMSGPRQKVSKVWGEPRDPVAGTITRQQIRYARRKGLPVPGTEQPAGRKPRAKKAAAGQVSA